MSIVNQKLEGTVVSTILESDLLEDECDRFSLESQDGSRQRSAVALLRDDPNIAVIFTIPTKTTNIYVTATDGDHALIRIILGTIEDVEREGPVKLGNVLLLNDERLRARDICGVLFLLPVTSRVLAYLPESIVVDGITHRFLLVTFLSNEEHLIWKERGQDALMDHFAATNKDLIAFGRKPEEM